MNYVGDYNYYRKQGFTEEELWMARKTDCMFNNWEHLTETEKEKYFIMARRLGL